MAACEWEFVLRLLSGGDFIFYCSNFWASLWVTNSHQHVGFNWWLLSENELCMCDRGRTKIQFILSKASWARFFSTQWKLLYGSIILMRQLKRLPEAQDQWSFPCVLTFPFPTALLRQTTVWLGACCGGSQCFIWAASLFMHISCVSQVRVSRPREHSVCFLAILRCSLRPDGRLFLSHFRGLWPNLVL